MKKLTLVSLTGGRRTRAVFVWLDYTPEGRAIVSEEWLAVTFGLRRGDGYRLG